MALMIEIPRKGKAEESDEEEVAEGEPSEEEMAAAGDELKAALKDGDGAQIAKAVCNIFELYEGE